MDDLVEKVAREMLREMDADPDVYRGMHGGYAPWDAVAKAIIPLIYEDAAKVALEFAPEDRWCDPHNVSVAGTTMEGIAEAIRSRSMAVVGES